MVETNPPRNSWPQTHQDDDSGGGAEDPASGLSRRRHRIDRFAHALKNSRRSPSFTATAGGGVELRLLWLGLRNQPGFAALLQPIALAANVDGGGVMQQSIQNRGGNDRVAEHRAPFSVALVRRENDA